MDVGQVPVARDPWGLVRFCEARFDRSYDDQHASWVATPWGWVCSFDRDFLRAACVEVIRINEECNVA